MGQNHMDEFFRTSFVKGTIKFGKKTSICYYFLVKSHKKEQPLDQLLSQHYL